MASVLLLQPALADFSETEREVFDLGGVEAEAPPQVQEILGEVGISDALEPEGLLEKLASALRERLGASLREAVQDAAAIAAVVLLCALAGTLCTEQTRKITDLGGVLAIGALAAGNMGSFIGLGTELLATLSDFSKVLLPSLAAAASAAGGVSSAAAKYAAAELFMDLLLTASQNLIVPLLYAYIALVIANAALGNQTLAGGAAFVKWLCVSAMTLLVLAFCVYLGVTGVINGSADAAAVRMAKTAISTALPVVGSILSDAAGTVVAGAGLLRGAVGVFGLLSVLCVCMTPFLRLGSRYLLFKLTAGLSAAFAEGRFSGLLSGLSSAFGMLLSLVGAGAMMLFLSLISFMKAVGGG